MFLLPIIGLSTLLTIGLTVLAIALVLIVIFYLMYHTFHGDLPAIMKFVVLIFLIVAGAFIVLSLL